MAADTPSLDTIFSAAIGISSEADRAAYIARACGENPELRGRVEKLVQAHFRAGRPLKEPAGESESIAFPFPEPPVAGALDERPGKVIGPYKLLEQIGEGGFGVVFLAEQQQPVRRKVALKVLKPGMDSKQVIARFEAERQALALMDHPNIARVFDGGATPAGRPYFVMELVKGVPLTAYCDQHRLTVTARLGLFVSVSQAVQHAHQKGIIHRDLKPSNILVAEHEGAPAVKVIDFGVAKALGQQLTDKTLHTGFAQLVGTPLYMSPEQAALGGLDVDTRSDIYSLGVVLYELLTGTTPFDRKRFLEAGYDGVRRILHEEEPPRPSSRLSTLGAAATAVSAQRKSDPRRLRQFFRGELDWIVMKALEKDRNRRYDTAGAFATDVQHYLHDEPVQACPPSRSYRLRKLLRKHRAAALTAAAFVGLLLAGVAVSTWQAVRATRAEGVAEARRLQAEAAEKKARAVNDFLIQEMIGAADPEEARGRKVTVEEVLDKAADKVGGAFAEQPEVEASVRVAIGLAYNDLGLYGKAEPHLRRCLELRQRVLGPEHRDTLQAVIELGDVLGYLNRLPEAEVLFRDALNVARRVLGDDDKTTTVLLHQYAWILGDEGRLPEAVELNRQCLEAQLRVLGPGDEETVTTMGNLTDDLTLLGQWSEAEQIASERLRLSLQAFPSDHPMILLARKNLLMVLIFEGKAREVEPLARENMDAAVRVWGPDHPRRWGTVSHLASGLYMQGRFKEAEQLGLEVLANQRRLGIPGDRTLLGLVLGATGRWDEAEDALRDAVKTRGQTGGPEHPQTLNALFALGTVLQASGQRAEAGQVLRQALDARRKVVPSTPYHAESLYAWAEHLLEEGDAGQAEAALREGLAIQRQVLPPKHRDIGQTLAALGWALTRQGRAKDGEPFLREGVDLCRTGYPLGHWVTADADTGLDWAAATAESRLGGCLTAQERRAEAEKLLLGSYPTLEAARGTPPYLRVDALERIVQLYETWGKADKAAEWRQKLDAERQKLGAEKKTEKKPAP
jgi:serine/threonine protein kinase